MNIATAIQRIGEGQDRAIASAYKWRKTAPGWWTANIDGVDVDVRYFGTKRPGACRIKGQPWKEFVFSTSLSTMKRRAIDLVDAMRGIDDEAPLGVKE